LSLIVTDLYFLSLITTDYHRLPGTTLQLWFGTVVSALSAIVYIKAQPYVDFVCSQVQAATLLELMLQLALSASECH
jgi:hypothetical protein